MSRVLFFGVPAHGHTNPTLPVVTELVRRGEHVIYYSSELFQPAIKQTGATFRSIGNFYNEQTYVDENLVRFSYTLIQITQEILAAIIPTVIEDKPDYIIFDSLCIWGKCIAQILKVPSISSITTLAYPASFLHPEMLASLPSLLPMMLHQVFAARKEFSKFSAIAKGLQQTYGIPRIQLGEVYNNLSELNIVYSTKEFQLYSHSFDDSFKFVGPSLGIHSDAPPLDELGNEKILYISLGTVFNDKPDFYRLCLQAFANSNHRIVMSVGDKIDIASLGSLPPNFIVKPFVSQLQLLQQTALFITHGGMNSVSEGCSAGVPLLMIPQAADQSSIAQRVEKFGAGKTLAPNKLNAQTLRETAEVILANPAFQVASAKLGSSFQQAGGPKRAVDEIEAFKRKRSI